VTTDEPTPDVVARIDVINERIAAAANAAGRDPADVTLLLATKTMPAELILTALRSGSTLIGENRVQEITEKADALAAVPHTTHLIGHLQRNKVGAVLPFIDCLQSLDSADLATRIERRLAEQEPDRVLQVMVQVNVSGESTKSGVVPEETTELVAAVRECPHLELTGLMTIGLNSPEGSAVRQGYARLRELRDELVPGGELSMGMSGDLEAAIAYYAEAFGAEVHHREIVESDGVEEALLKVAESYIQLLTPITETSPVAKAIEKRGEGIHHVGYRVGSTEEVLEHCKAEGARVVDDHPRTGSRGTTVAFLHPKSSFGALIELVQE
jgi:pyridoxal phosphate enzyme (YggS family)